MKTGYNFAGVRVNNIVHAAALIRLLIKGRQNLSKAEQVKDAKYREMISADINRKVNKYSTDPFEAGLLFAANFKEYSLEDQLRLTDIIFADMQAWIDERRPSKK